MGKINMQIDKMNPLMRGCKRHSWFIKSTWIMMILMTAFLWQCEKDTFEGETIGVCPEVISSDPDNGATNVVTNKIITATFNVAMEPASISGVTYTIKQGDVMVSGEVTYAGKIATFTPTKPLEANKTYTGTISKKVKDPDGNYPKENYIWSFSTGNVPVVISTDPLSAISKVPLNKIITATFSTAMDPATINTATFMINQGDNPIDGTVSYSEKSATVSSTSPRADMDNQGTNLKAANVSSLENTATFTPTNPLADNTVYTGTISIGAKDVAGNAMAHHYKWSFSTAQTTYTITLSSNPAEGGSTSGGGLFNEDDEATVVAVPVTGYTFINWTEGSNVVSTSSNYTFTATSERELVANFDIDTYSLNVNASNGSVNLVPNQTTFNFGETVLLTAVPNSGYYFTGWDGDATGTSSSYTIVMNSDKDITANFAEVQANSYTLNVSATNGSVNKNPNSTTYNEGETVLLTATPNAGYAFTSWNGDATGSENPLTIVMDEDKEITANFSSLTNGFALTIISENGNVMKNPDKIEYDDGDNVELTATANSGYTFDSWGGDASGSDNPLTIVMDRDKEITANYTVEESLGPGEVNLGTAGNFAILTKSGISTNGTTLITGDIGVSPIDHTAITGFSETMDLSGEFSESIYVVGKIYAADYAAPTPTYISTAISDQENAYSTAMGLTLSVINNLGGGDISGMTLAPGLYKWGTGLLITNAGVTLDGGPNDTWVFQIADDFTINDNAIITLTGGAKAENIFWVTSTQALLGSNVDFSGILLAQTLISLNSGTTVHGRMLCQTAVTLLSSTVTEP